MNGAGLAVVIILVIIGIAVFGILGAAAEKKRRAAFLSWASAHGYTYAPRDNRYADLPWGAPFGQGSGRQAQDVVTGTSGNRHFLCFTLRFQTTSSNGKTTQTQTHYYAIHAVRLPKALRELMGGNEYL